MNSSCILLKNHRNNDVFFFHTFFFYILVFLKHMHIPKKNPKLKGFFSKNTDILFDIQSFYVFFFFKICSIYYFRIIYRTTYIVPAQGPNLLDVRLRVNLLSKNSRPFMWLLLQCMGVQYLKAWGMCVHLLRKAMLSRFYSDALKANGGAKGRYIPILLARLLRCFINYY